jgi:hypothetical protein
MMEFFSFNWQVFVFYFFIGCSINVYVQNILDATDRNWMSKNQYLKFASLNLAFLFGTIYLFATARTLGRKLAFFAVMIALQLSYGVIQDLWLDKNRPD